MSEIKLISPMLDNFTMGDPIRDHNGVRCCPAIENHTDDKFIVKIISVPASQTQVEALLLSGACSDKDSALSYYQTITDDVVEEIKLQQKLSQLEGFLPFDNYQVAPMEGEVGFDVYMLSQYRNTLEQKLRHSTMHHIDAINLALDLCAALAVCRRSGYLYVDLKPENIYLSNEKGYQIGDIGFIKLSSLKYASLPDRYRSNYTAPEIADAFSCLNTTIDTYALGLILYQVFNDGLLPSMDEQTIAPPAYADYEMAEIILKACATNPEDRYQDPVDMGQDIVGYMQRNGANDTPIAPVAEVIEAPIAESEPSDIDLPEDDAVVLEDVAEEPEEITEEINPEDVTEEHIFSEDEDGNLTIIEDENIDETAPDQIDEEIAYGEVSEEVNDILNQADDLLAHPTPDPVVQPEPIDVPIPEMVVSDETKVVPVVEGEAQMEALQEAIEEAFEESADEEIIEVEDDVAEDGQDDEDEEEAPSKKSHWLRNLFLAILVIAILVAGFFFYTRYYLQPIESIVLEEGKNCNITVNVNSKIDESKLTVICSDAYGNQLLRPVVDGKAYFEDLASNSAYTIKVVVSGFHRLTGDTSTAFTTPPQTNIVQFSAVTGSEDGSAILGFTIEGTVDAKQWNIAYSTAGEEEKSVDFAGHMVTVTGLTPGKEYTFKLTPNENILVTGTTEITHIANNLVKPGELTINSFSGGKVTASWTAPGDANVESWTVRCYNEKDFNETKVVSDTTVAFEGLVQSEEYTIEVTAAGMSVGERVFVPANAITVTGLKAGTGYKNSVHLSWQCDSIPDDGWRLVYSIDGLVMPEITVEDANEIEIPHKAPSSIYTFTLETAGGVPVLGGKLKAKIPDASNFNSHNVKPENMEFKMCIRPSKSGWDRYDVSSKDYTDTFEAGQKAAFVIKLSKKAKSSSEFITRLFVIRDEAGNVVSIESNNKRWSKMWSGRYCELDIPSLPQANGKYTMQVYFDGAFVHEQDFQIK